MYRPNKRLWKHIALLPQKKPPAMMCSCASLQRPGEVAVTKKAAGGSQQAGDGAVVRKKSATASAVAKKGRASSTDKGTHLLNLICAYIPLQLHLTVQSSELLVWSYIYNSSIPPLLTSRQNIMVTPHQKRRVCVTFVFRRFVVCSSLYANTWLFRAGNYEADNKKTDIMQV